MKQKISLLLLILINLLFSNLNAQIKSGENSVLWKVRHPNSLYTSYLLGTNHMFGKEWLNSFPVIDSLMRFSATFVSEGHPPPSVTTNLEAKIKKEAELKDLMKVTGDEKRTAKELFGRDYDLVNSYFVRVSDWEISSLDTIQAPKMLVLSSLQMYLFREFFVKLHMNVSGDGVIVDYVLYLKADSIKKQMVVLDSTKILKKIYNSSEKPINELARSIIQVIKFLTNKDTTGDENLENKDKTSVLKFMNLYNRGLYIYDFDKKIPRDDKILLGERNKDWLKQLPGHIKSSSCFIAVGAAHLNYKGGLIQELTKKGFIITPINLSN